MPIEGVSFEDEHFHPTITHVADGDVYMVVGKEHSSIVKLEGFVVSGVSTSGPSS